MLRRLTFAIGLSLLAAPLRAQSSSEPLLVFTIYGGLAEGRSLWTIPQQGLLVNGSAQQDTVLLARQLRPGLVAGLTGTLYRSPHLGVSVDIGYFGIGSEQRCIGPLSYKPDSSNQNSQVCTNATGTHVGTNVVGFLAGATYRFAPGASVEPFVRLTAGPGLLGNSSFIETTGIFFASGVCSAGCVEPLLVESNKPDVTWIVNASAGITVSAGDSYRIRMEFRDIITSLPVATGPRDPADNSSFPTVSNSIKHLPSFLFGLDIMLERRRGRRY